jgi:hypothetical protein
MIATPGLRAKRPEGEFVPRMLRVRPQLGFNPI